MSQVGSVLVAVLLACLTGCASVPTSEEEETAEPEIESSKDAKPKKAEESPPSSPAPSTPSSPTPETPEAPAPTTPTPPTTPPALPPFFALRVNDECLDVPEGNHADGVELMTYKCHGDSNQVFSVGPNTTLRSSAGKCVDASGSAMADGTKVILWPCNGGANQRVERVGETLQLLGKCLTARNGKVFIAQCAGSVDQYWSVK